MNIEKVHIENFKCFNGPFDVEFNNGINLLVGNNEAGKSTILEAIHLALTGLINAHYLKNELTQYLFNNTVLSNFFSELKQGKNPELPYFLIEVYFQENSFPEFEGDGNSAKKKGTGVSLKVEFDEIYNQAYIELQKKDFSTLPVEYYKITWQAFSRYGITSRNIPIKSVLIDSSSHRYANGSDVYISRIIKENLDEEQLANISQAFRNLREDFMNDDCIKNINEQVQKQSKISLDKSIEISVDLSPRNAWENTLMTYLDKVPFHQIGKGEQCIIKTNLSLSHKKTKEANLILIEEPENHLSYSKLSELLNSVKNNCNDKQIIISTHSSFVANKLGLQNLILLKRDKTGLHNTFHFEDLEDTTYDYFKKLPGYDTLRLILCKKAILVEGDSDELIIQKAYIDKNGMLPIENGIDVISLRRLSFKRFLDISKALKQETAVVTDNDANYDKNIKHKYENYLSISNIKIFADNDNNINTLEPQLVNANRTQLNILCKAIGINYEQYNTAELITNYMIRNKTKYALQIFETKEKIMYPEYINKTIQWCDEE